MSEANPKPAPRATREWWRGASIYQIYPRSFADSNGDGVGDLPGITAHLDHVASLGVDAIWLSPFFPSPMKDFGYDVADYCDVDPIFGTLDDFDALVQRAHALGLKVIVDQVYSHTSDVHGWFLESRSDRTNPKADWYVWADAKSDGGPPNNWQSVFGGPAWTWDARRRQYYLHNFLSSQPQLNVRNPAVQQALIEVGCFWLDRGVDGFRLDAINFTMHNPALTDNPPAPDDGSPRTRSFDYQLHIHNQSQPEIPDFLARVRANLDAYGDRFTVAEVGGADSDREMKLFTHRERGLNTAYGFDFLYASELTPRIIRDAVERWPSGPDMSWPSWAFENHDAPRALSRWADPADYGRFARMKMLLLATLRGNIFLYYGEELGLTQVEVGYDDLQDPEAISNWPLTLSRDGARTPMPWRHDAHALGFTSGKPWLPVGPDHAGLAVDVQAADPGSMLAFTREVLALRKAYDALLIGDMTVIEASDKLLVFERTYDGEHMICAFNFAHEDSGWEPPQPARWQVVARSRDGEGWSLPALSGFVARRIG
ncbi:alpha-glucosidase family protein [Sphingomonas cannabina]|uniref:alpha-glucosidase family protein n=1 Tax=Sphingomonas cannabina TaxID=2899123 RepID=UPI001F1CE768|nr:alpha-glucosidase family protein [Sphingomonas cannabina]UIJ45145.1 alpha-glucosidase family protein [Sphingomonas cannabina]